MTDPDALRPDQSEGDPTELLLGTLDMLRAAVDHKVVGLDDVALRSSVLPSGWTPLEMVKHLVFMEQRWIRWGFLAQPVDAPWGDRTDGDVAQPWATHDTDHLDGLLARMHAGGELTRRAAEGVPLGTPAALGGRFQPGDVAPTLGWVLVHVLQEYARHAGHLDVVRELLDGSTGE